MITFFIEGDPKAQPRARRSKFGGVYNPNDNGVKEWKQLITWKARAEGGRMKIPRPITGPIQLTLIFKILRPKSHFRTGKNSHLIKDSHKCEWHFQKPDDDNLKKAVQDALTASGIWKDDCQVCFSIIAKHWVQKKPGVEIQIKSLE